MPLCLLLLASRPATRPATAPASRPATQPSEQLVYVTRTGQKYHGQHCQFARNAQAIRLSEAKSRGLTPCARCKGQTRGK